MVVAMDLATVTYTSAGGIARVALNRPAQLNAIRASRSRAVSSCCSSPISSSPTRARASVISTPTSGWWLAAEAASACRASWAPGAPRS